MRPCLKKKEYLASRWLQCHLKGRDAWHSAVGLIPRSRGVDTFPAAALLPSMAVSHLCGCWTRTHQPPWLVLTVTLEGVDCDALILIMACWVVFSDRFCLLHTSLACLPTPAQCGPFSNSSQSTFGIYSWGFIERVVCYMNLTYLVVSHIKKCKSTLF